MELSFGMPRYMYQSYFIQSAIIRGVQPTYDNEIFGIVWDVDLSILLDVQKKNGEVFPYTLNIRVNYRKDEEGNILSWGSAFKISRLFEVLQLNGRLDEQGRIPEGCLEQLIGKEIYVLSYRTGVKEDGSPKFQMWDIIDVTKESLAKEFLSSLDKGYPKNFSPASLSGREQKDVPLSPAVYGNQTFNNDTEDIF